MARLKNVVTAVVVNVPDGHPITTDSQWVPVETPKPEKPKK